MYLLDATAELQLADTRARERRAEAARTVRSGGGSRQRRGPQPTGSACCAYASDTRSKPRRRRSRPQPLLMGHGASTPPTTDREGAAHDHSACR